jgi:predicted dehydrogenase
MRTTRRDLLKGGVCLIGGAPLGWRSRTDAKVYRAAVIGRTGGGDYGHGWERVFAGLENVTLEAIADDNPEGLKKAAERSGAGRLYRDYKEMLRVEKPDLVSIAPRHPDCHREMALEALRFCKGLFIEKPLTETPADADAVLDAANRAGARIVVAHNRRWMPEFAQVKRLLEEGLVGSIRQVNIQGKQDTRVGGEDMIVLGVHDFDLMRFYFGDPSWCLASVTRDGRDIANGDAHKGREPYLVAGDTIHALFGFPENIVLHWSSVRTKDAWNAANPAKGEKWVIEIYGTRGILAFRSGIGFAWLNSPYLVDGAVPADWKALPQPARWDWPKHDRHPIKSLVRAIETGSDPICSGTDGRWAVEMTAAVYESARTRARVAFPLKERGNPLLRL